MMGRSMLAYIPVNIATLLVSFGGIVILTRLFGAAEYGRYALAMITMMGVHMTLFTWMEAAMARFQARAERSGQVHHHTKTLYVTALLCVAPVWALCLGILYLLPLDTHMQRILAVAISSTSLQVFFNLGMEAHRAAHRIGRYSASFSAHSLLSFTLGIVLIMTTPLRETGPFLGIIIATLTVGGLDLLFMHRAMHRGQFQAQRAIDYFKYGFPIGISLILAYLLTTADMYIITGLLGSASAGEYSASYNLANRSVDVLFIWIGMAVTPIAVTAIEKEGLEKSRDIMRQYGATLLLIAMPAATGIALIAEPAGFILGEDVRRGAVKIMPLIAFAGVLNGMISYYAQRAFMLSGKTQMFVWALVPPVGLNIALNFILIPKFGLMGAVYATVISYGLGFAVAVAIGRRYYPLPLPIKAFAQIALACLVMAGFVSQLPISGQLPDIFEILIKAALGSTVYAAVCYLLNAAGCRDFVKTRRGASRRAMPSGIHSSGASL